MHAGGKCCQYQFEIFYPILYDILHCIPATCKRYYFTSSSYYLILTDTVCNLSKIFLKMVLNFKSISYPYPKVLLVYLHVKVDTVDNLDNLHNWYLFI